MILVRFANILIIITMVSMKQTQIIIYKASESLVNVLPFLKLFDGVCYKWSCCCYGTEGC